MNEEVKPTSARDYLAEFARRSDREDPPTFVGRGDILQRMEDDLQNRLLRWREGASDAWRGGTWLVQGAPGAGKTALLAQLRKRVAQPPVRTCTLHVRDLRDPSGCHRQLAEALWPGAGKAMGARTTSTGDTALHVPGLHAGRSVATDSPVMTWDDFRSSARAQPERLHPVVLLIDEIQNVAGDRAGAPAGFLQWLHEATDNLPILPVYGGLAWSEDHLDGLGISRLSDNGHVDTLAPLTDAECMAAVRRFVLNPKHRIRTAGAEDPVIAAWAGAIAEKCSGWPQHLHGSLRALARELLAEDVGRALARAQPARAAADAEQARTDYYNKRLGSGRLQGSDLLAVVGLLAVQAGAEAGAPLNVATLGAGLQQFATWAGPSRPELQFPEGFTGTRFVRDGLIGAGLLHQTTPPVRRLSAPIPSLVTYVQQHEDYAPLWETVREYLAHSMPEGSPHLTALASLLPAASSAALRPETAPFKP